MNCFLHSAKGHHPLQAAVFARPAMLDRLPAELLARLLSRLGVENVLACAQTCTAFRSQMTGANPPRTVVEEALSMAAAEQGCAPCTTTVPAGFGSLLEYLGWQIVRDRACAL